MPATTRAFVKASVIYLCLGCLLGALLLVNRWVDLGAVVVPLRDSHIVFLIVGWLTQLILGVAWWLFPPLEIRLHSDGRHWERHGQTQRGSETLFWVTFVLLNVGIVLEAVCMPLAYWTRIETFDVVGRVAGLLLCTAAIVFVISMWARVREMGRKGGPAA